MAARKLSYIEALASLRTRFAAKWRENSETKCWEWTGALCGGYGVIWSAIIGKRDQAHRVSYQLHKGPIVETLHIDHLCRNRRCVNPDHLEAVTQAINNERAAPFGAQKNKQFCPRGHPYDEANTTVLKDGRRDCRQCILERARARRKRISEGKGFVQRKERTHCPQGHEYNSENTYILKGKRHCRICIRDRQREFQRKKFGRKPRIFRRTNK